jgi:hypothetical protein
VLGFLSPATSVDFDTTTGAVSMAGDGAGADAVVLLGNDAGQIFGNCTVTRLHRGTRRLLAPRRGRLSEDPRPNRPARRCTGRMETTTEARARSRG